METQAPSILIVEDDPDISFALQEVLEMEGFRVGTARNGLDALSQIERRGLPSLIFLDLMMPVMDGSQFLEARATDPGLCSVPVVIVSAAGERARFVRTEAFLRKPVSLDEIIAKAREYVHPAA